MTEEQINELREGIVNSISTVPGLVGLVNKESQAQTLRVLTETNYGKGIDIIPTSNGVEIKIFIIASLNVRTEIVSRELSSAVESYFKANNYKISKINIYIKGVK
ncbi:MAG: Asp23/Gls24 family envelope stress response protein [Mycoplasmatales bacterium]|nr:Asp23/Gls24 family envelope stress response protein [Mycoplasmatales bacterium]